MNETLDLALDLLKRESITPEDAGCQDLMIARLEALDFKVERMRFGEVDNFYARRGTNGPLLVFAGHTDVVPTGPLDQWHTPPFEPTIKDGQLYARGAADMKASLAAFITSIEAFVKENPDHQGSIGLLITSDEEGIATEGTVKVVETLKARGEHFDFCIVGEPTSNQTVGDMVKNGRRGSLGCELVVKGVQGHIAYPHLVKNPIHFVAPAIHDLVETVWDEGNDYFPPTSFQVSNINGGTGATNVVPGEVKLIFNFRFCPEFNGNGSTAENIQSRVIAILDDNKLDYTLNWTLNQPYITPRGNLVNAVEDAIEESFMIKPELSTTGGTSDGRFIADICTEVVEFGPLNKTIHQINECVGVEDLEPLKRAYQLTLEKLIK